MKYINKLSEDQIFKLKTVIYILQSTDVVSFGKGKPMEEEKIVNFEKENNVTLPLELIVYLLCVSESTYKDHLNWIPIVLSSSNIEMMPTVDNDNQYYKQTKLCSEDSQKYENDNDLYDNKLAELEKEKNKTKVLNLRRVGCGYTDHIILENIGDKYIGQIWHDKFTGNGVFKRVDYSFLDYSSNLCSN